MNSNYQGYFFIGIKGVMMANMAVILKKMGKSVTGADIEEEFITDKLLFQNNIKYQIGFDKLPDGVDCLVYAASHGGTNNPLVVEAQKRNIKTIHQAELLGEIMQGFKTKIAVCGCHGKTTTSSLLSYALLNLKTNPSYCVGAPYFGATQGSDFQEKNYFVVEADEYGVNPPLDKTPKFNFLNPDYIICTNIDFDHPDVYKDLEETKSAFYKFFDNSNHRKKLILNIDDENLLRIFEKLDKTKYITFGTNEKVDYRILNIKNTINETQFELTCDCSYPELVSGSVSNQMLKPIRQAQVKSVQHDKHIQYKFHIPLYGEKNVLNATGVIVMLLQLGFKPNEIQKAIAGFTGAERRLQKVYEGKGIQLFDDYAHHPNEIKATLDALRKRFPKRRLLVIFQPHTYSRTKQLVNEFALSLSLFDLVYLLPIFASARERNDQTIDSSAIAKLSPKKITCFENISQLTAYLPHDLHSGDIIVTMGAGDVYKLKDDLIKLIKHIT